MNVEHHAIAFGTAHNGSDDDQRVLGDKVPDAAFLLLGLLARVRLNVELEGVGGADEKQQAAETLQK